MKNDIKEIMKKNSLYAIRSYLIVSFSLGGILIITFIALLIKDYAVYGLFCLVLGIIFIVLGFMLRAKACNTEWVKLTFEVEKDFDLNLLYSDNYVAISNNYILFYNNRNVAKITDILYYFINNNVITLYVRDSMNNVFTYIMKYSNPSAFNDITNILKNKAYDCNVLYKDNNIMLTASALFDINKVCGRDIIVLRNIKEIIKCDNNSFGIYAKYNGKDVSAVYRYNDSNVCNQTFVFLCNNCSGAKVYRSMEEYNNK